MSSEPPIAVTGLTGFLGSHIGLALMERGLPVRGVVRTPSKGDWLRDRGADLHAADLADVSGLARGFSGCAAVVANAALSVRGKSPPLQDFLDANVAGTENVLRAAAEAGVRRVVYISSISIYKTRLGEVMDEDSEQVDASSARRSLSRVTTNWRYALSKQQGEARAWALADELGLELTTIRPGPIYGSRDHKLTASYAQRVAGWLALAPTIGVPHVHAGDVAIAVCGALANPASVGRAYNTAGTTVQVAAALAAARDALGASSRLLRIPLPLQVQFSDARAEAELGYRSRPISEGMQEALGESD